MESQVWEVCGGVQGQSLGFSGVSGPELEFKPGCESGHNFNLHKHYRKLLGTYSFAVSSSPIPGASSRMLLSTRFYKD